MHQRLTEGSHELLDDVDALGFTCGCDGVRDDVECSIENSSWLL